MPQTPEEFVRKFNNSDSVMVINIFRSLEANIGQLEPGKEKDDMMAKLAAMNTKFPHLKSSNSLSLDVDMEGEEGGMPPPFSHQVATKYLRLYRSAKSRNKDFNLSLKDIGELLKQEKCFYTGVTLTQDGKAYQKTIDRVDNTKGYVKGNVVTASHLANQIKNSLFEDPSSSLKCNMQFMAKLLIKMKKTIEEEE